MGAHIEHERIHASGRMHTPVRSLQEVLKLLGPKSYACDVRRNVPFELTVHVCQLRNCVYDFTRFPLRPSRHKSLFQCEPPVHFRLYILIQLALLDITLLCLLLNEPCLHMNMCAPTHGRTHTCTYTQQKP